jgi:20S proteasome alpha/beta subunit
MAQKVGKAGVKKEKGYLYFVDKAGDVSRAKMARGGKKGGRPEKVAKVGVKKEKGYLYFVDKQGDVSRAKMARGR